MEDSVFFSLNACLAEHRPIALVTVIASAGSSPGKPGAMMTVQPDGSCAGTVGGGNLEYQVIDRALCCLRNGEHQEISFSLKSGSDLGMTCGGELRVFIRVFQPQPQLVIVGAGHIGLELYTLALYQGFRVQVVDDRPEILSPERFPRALRIVKDDIAAYLHECAFGPQDYIAIATKSHESDRLVLAAVIDSEAGYIGLIGSRNKIRLAFSHLEGQGVERHKLDAVYAPMGLDIAAVRPKEIAMSIMSEILLVKNRGSLNHMRSIKGYSS